MRDSPPTKPVAPPIFQGEEALLSEWGQDDPCLHHLHLLWRACEAVNPQLRSAAFEHFGRHYERCGACWENVLITADKTTEPLKREIYFNLYHLSQFALMKREGGDFEVNQTKEGIWVRIAYPPEFDELWTGGEVFTPSAPDGEAWTILDVRDKTLFEKPFPVLQRLDEVSSTEVKRFDREGGQSIQWWSIIGDRKASLLVRWNGIVKTVAEDWTLRGRYTPLMLGEAAREAAASPAARDRVPEDRLGEEALKLRQLALEYDGRSKFAGFAKARLRHRRIDAQRHDEGHAAGLEDGAPLEDAAIDPERIEKEAKDHETRLHARILRAQLESRLSPPERRILKLNVDQDLTDTAIAAKLGLTRETVNRKLNRIKKIAAKLRS